MANKIIDSMLNCIASKMKRIDVSSKITKTGSITVSNMTCYKQGEVVNINGQFVLGGAMATGLTLEMFDVAPELTAEDDEYMNALTAYCGKGNVSMAYQLGKIYLHNNGSTLAIGTAVAFSGSWTIGGGSI